MRRPWVEDGRMLADHVRMREWPDFKWFVDWGQSNGGNNDYLLMLGSLMANNGMGVRGGQSNHDS